MVAMRTDAAAAASAPLSTGATLASARRRCGRLGMLPLEPPPWWIRRWCGLGIRWVVGREAASRRLPPRRDLSHRGDGVFIY
uniref:Uncharacterized protein n=1 Tax=Oryza meridionalis TaxID=40149 RepID=A0A0E0E4E8_9ORYZ